MPQEKNLPVPFSEWNQTPKTSMPGVCFFFAVSTPLAFLLLLLRSVACWLPVLDGTGPLNCCRLSV